MEKIIEVPALWSSDEGLCSPTTLLLLKAGSTIAHAETGGVFAVVGTSRIVGWGELDTDAAVIISDEGFGGSFLVSEQAWNNLRAEAA